MNLNRPKFKYILLIIIFTIKAYNINYLKRKKKIGVIGLEHSQNVGNNLLKYAIFVKLSELGYSPYIVGKRYYDHNISFITNAVNIKLIQNFSEINENDFDILMVNSDQTWRKWDKNFYDIAFLKFAENWTKTKFTYAVSLGTENWQFSKEDEIIAKKLLKNFTGISVRERDSVNQIEKYLGFKAQFVLDPTFLIEKKRYLKIINNYKSSIINQTNNENYIFAYILTTLNQIENYLISVEKLLKIKIFQLNVGNKNEVFEFLYGINNCKAVITDSFHGTIFSIMFKKPFISFVNGWNDKSRFKSLDIIFNIKNRIFNYDSVPPIELLNSPLIINDKKLKILKRKSLNFLKQNLALSL